MPQSKIKSLIWIGVSVLVALLGGYASYIQGLWRIHYLSSEEFPIQGLDVSHHQGDIRWDEVPKDRFQFVYIKATEGGDFKDKKFLENWEGARSAGFKVGAYHFFTLCRSGADQAKNFIESVPQESSSLSPVIDLEYVGNCAERPPKEIFLQELYVYEKKIQEQYYKQPILYTTYEFYEDYLKDTKYSKYPLWIRSIWSRPVAEDFDDLRVWQYADNARIPGIDTAVDLNAHLPE